MKEAEQLEELKENLEWQRDWIDYVIDKIISQLESVKIKELPYVQEKIDYWKRVKELNK